MSTDIVMESSIEDSYIYQSFNAANAVIEKIVKYVKTGVVLDPSYFEEQYSQIKKGYISPLSSKVVEAYERGDLELLYSRETKVGLAFPFIIRKNEKGTIVATIFIASFAVVDNNNNLNIPVQKLYALLESAFVGLELQRNPMKIQRNAALMKICSSVYTQMMMRILNKEYALSLDKELYDKVTYIATRFFLTNVWEYPNVNLIDSYAKQGLKYISDFDLSMLDEGYKSANIKNLDDLMKYLATVSPRMKELNTRYYIERYVNTYHGSSILSIDYLPYVFFVIINILIGSFLISQTTLNDIIKKSTPGINKFYIELSKIL